MDTYPTVKISPDAFATNRRYRNAYQVSDTVVSIGGVLKILGYVGGGVVGLVGVLAGSQLPSPIAGLVVFYCLVIGADL